MINMRSTLEKHNRRYCIYIFIIIMMISQCFTDDFHVFVKEDQVEKPDPNNNNFIPESPFYPWLYSFPPWHHPYNPEPRDIRPSIESKRSKFISRILTPPTTDKKSNKDSIKKLTLEDFISDTRDSRSIINNENISNGNLPLSQNKKSLRPFQDLSPEGTSGVPSGLFGRSEFQNGESVNSFQFVDDRLSRFPDFNNRFIRPPEPNFEKSSNGFNNVITVPKFDPLPLEEHQLLPKSSKDQKFNPLPLEKHQSLIASSKFPKFDPLPLEEHRPQSVSSNIPNINLLPLEEQTIPVFSSRNNEQRDSDFVNPQENGQKSPVIFPSTLISEQEERGEDNEQDSPVIFPSSSAFEEAGIVQQQPVIFPSTLIFEDPDLQGRFLTAGDKEFLPFTPRGLNPRDPRDLQTSDSNHPRSIQEIILHQSVRRPPRFVQPRSRFRRPRRGFLSWIWPRR